MRTRLFKKRENLFVYSRNKQLFSSRSQLVNLGRDFAAMGVYPVIRDSTKSIYKKMK